MKIAKYGALGVLTLVACEGEQSGTRLSTQAVEAVCLGPTVGVPAGGWECGQPLSVQCGAPVPAIYLRDDCGQALRATDVVTNEVGTQTVEVLRADGSVACTSPLTVLAGPPVITPRTLYLWPPNHKLHEVSIEDCIGAYASCDPDLHAEFTWGSSDELVNGKGDGNHAPDILFDGCDRVQLRSERQGPKDGRVYKLGVRVVDGAGNATDSQCTVIVDHDQRGVDGADSGEAYRISLDGTGGLPLCDGLPPALPPVTPPVGEPDTTPAGI